MLITPIGVKIKRNLNFVTIPKERGDFMRPVLGDSEDYYPTWNTYSNRLHHSQANELKKRLRLVASG
jgi:hypothetical protein